MKKMNKVVAVLTAVVGLGSWPTQASVSVSDFSNGGSGSVFTAVGTGSQVIPDDNLSGVAYAMTFSTGGLNINDVSITLNISGGYNGDLYAYLSNGSTLVQLLNPNSAVSTSGFNNVTLGETGGSIPAGGSGSLTGSYIAYGNLATLNGMDPSGTWTLFFADESPGDTSTLTGFDVSFTTSPVPEPVNAALVLCAGVFGLFGLGKYYRAHKQSNQPQ